MRRRARIRRLPRWLLAPAAAAGLTLLIAQHASSAAFTASTADGGNQVTAATSFCASPGGPTPYTASADTTAYQQNPTTGYGSNVATGVGSQSGANARAFVRFSLPTLGSHCSITAATLQLYSYDPDAGGTIDAYRADPNAALWTEAGLFWNNMPAPVGAAVGSASLSVAGWQTWDVTTLVQTLYTTANNGFVLRDRTESAGIARWQLYDSDEATNKPRLVLTWG